MRRTHFVLIAVAVAALASRGTLFGAGPSFHPDATFKGSNLTGWHPVGGAAWRADNGEIVGTPQQPDGGWLMLDRSYQDVGFYASFQCAPGCRTGVMLRAEKTAGGTKGIYMALTDGDLGVYRVTLDEHGKMLTREPLRFVGGQVRIAPPPDPNAPARGGGPARGAAPAVKLPLSAPDTSLKPGEWNQIEIYLDGTVIRPLLNGGNARTGAADIDAGNFGPLALYVGGAGTVRFKDVAYTDLSIKTRAVEEVSKHFTLQRLSDFYYSWGAGAADINHDNVLDVVSGPHVFYGPDYRKRSEIYLQLTTNPSDTFATDAWMQFVSDFTGDGWADAVNCSFSGDVGCTLYVNPKGEPRRWDKHLVVPAYQTEIGLLRDVDGDGRPEIVYGAEGQLRYAKPDPANPTGTWLVRNVSERGYATAHGLGTGDVNGDGRIDILNPFGWWEQPPAASDGPWRYHPQAFAWYKRGMGGSVMAVYDVNGDKLNDVVTVLASHGWGLGWFEQKRDTQGNISFERHIIMDDLSAKNAGGVTFSQPHGSSFGDVDGDGVTDFIVGKRFWSHSDSYLDPEPYAPAVLYWYRTVRNPKAPGGAEFIPELVHNHSGTGSDVLPVDLNRDGRLDIVTATRFGTFIFWGQPRK